MGVCFLLWVGVCFCVLCVLFIVVLCMNIVCVVCMSFVCVCVCVLCVEDGSITVFRNPEVRISHVTA